MRKHWSRRGRHDMFKSLENALYTVDREKYEIIRQRANAFNTNYTGSNIIQDDIFHIIENYVFQHGMRLELFRYPVGDDAFCACTFIRSGSVFVVINSAMTVSKQIFAAAHEFYHLYNYFEDYDPTYQQHGSILDSLTIDEETTKQEEKEANAFAGLILAPARSIREQMDIYHIHRDIISIKDILMLMEIYAIPYKAMVLRLYEDEIIGEEKVREFFGITEKEIALQCELTGRAKRWQRADNDIVFGSLIEKMERVSGLDAVDEEHIRQDKVRVTEIMKNISGKA